MASSFDTTDSFLRSALLGILAPAAGLAIYSAISAMIPLFVVTSMALAVPILAISLTAIGMTRVTFHRLMIAILSAAIGISALWIMRLGIGFGFDLTFSALSDGVYGIWSLIELKANGSFLALEKHGQSSSLTGSALKTLWLVEAGGFALFTLVMFHFGPRILGD